MCKLNLRNTLTGEIRTINNAKANGTNSVFCLYAGGRFRRCWHGVLSFDTDAKTDATAQLLTPWVMCDESSSAPTPSATVNVKTVEEPTSTPHRKPAAGEGKPAAIPTENPLQAETPSGDAISAAFAPLFTGVANTVKTQILSELRPLIEQAASNVKNTTELEVKTITGTHTVTGVFHEKFNDILQLVGNNIPVYLFGPAGTGKSYTAKQIAKALGLDFHYSTTVQNVYELTGFIDAGGVYHTTEFRQAFENGGVFMIDELDASCPESLVCINTAIANGCFAFPDKAVTAHKDFRVIAAGNTVGTGANDEYTGRAVIDASTLNRFARIYFGYSDGVEHSLTDDNSIIEFAHEMRRIKRTYNLTGVIFSYREIGRLNTAKQLFSDNDVNALSVAFTGGLTDGVINTLSSYCRLIGNRWADALEETANKPRDWDF